MSGANTKNSSSSTGNISSRLPLWLPFAILAAAGVVLWLRWDSIPDRWVIHWNLRGEPDGWVTRTMAAVILFPLGFGLIVVLILELTKVFVARSTHRRVSARLSSEAADAFADMTRDLLSVIQIAVSLIFAMMALVLPLTQPQSPWLFVATTLGIVAASILIGMSRWVRRARAMRAAGLLEGLEGWNGLTYNNPADPRLWVPKITGPGYTLNFARPAAWLVLVGILAVPVALLFVIIILST